MIFLWLCRCSQQVFLAHKGKKVGKRQQDGSFLPPLTSPRQMTSCKMHNIRSSQLKHICCTAHTCTRQMARGDTGSPVCWLRMQPAHGGAAGSSQLSALHAAEHIPPSLAHAPIPAPLLPLLPADSLSPLCTAPPAALLKARPSW